MMFYVHLKDMNKLKVMLKKNQNCNYDMDIIITKGIYNNNNNNFQYIYNKNRANIEIAKVRKDFDKELSAMKAKLLRKELDTQSLNQKIKALQEQINIKTKENEELATICDALVSKLENK